ncbi:pyridine nucleotide-disulfide oxidoreductase [Streptomyces humidus]|uniref:Pyridine nucleotide-disulfide oxidoreductase n=1 Tax=Streptomyces humidus TaxID=52259 RepID=A0A918FSG6_9ACTN|nr:FAD-dependent oxidoreductase [Streptomyces humidus]GGR77247.1 pyridine nucleotide-disulfide oxidoreductase [Streptomyces humidus]
MAPVTEDVDLLVVGGGKAGKTLAMDRARGGARVAMAERGMIGGSCINVACIPTKALVASARARRALDRGRELGLVVGDVRTDVDLLRAHRSDVVDAMVALNHKQFLDSGMDLVIGQARFVAERTVEVRTADGGGRVLRGADTVIDTGTRPRLPDIPGLDRAGALTSESLLRLERIPDRLTVLGDGPIGLEFADMFAAFGSRVTVVSRHSRLLPQEDAEIAAAVGDLLSGHGVTVLFERRVARVGRDAGGEVTVVLEDGLEITGDDLLVAVGRVPVTEELDLERAGVAVTAAGFVDVDEHLATTAQHTWAAGDVAGSPQFTHAALDDYRILKENLAGGSRSTRDRLIPRTTFLGLDLAHVGLTEEQARRLGHRVKIARLPVAAIPRARTTGETQGLWKAVVDAETHRILGATLLGPETGETLTTVQTAMLAGLPCTALRDMVISHPTMTEGLNMLFANLTEDQDTSGR